MERFCCDECLLLDLECPDIITELIEESYINNHLAKLKEFAKNDKKMLTIKTCGCQFHRLCLLEILDSYNDIQWINEHRLDKETSTYFIPCYKCHKIIIDNIPITLSNPENINNVLVKFAVDSLLNEELQETLFFTVSKN